MSLALNKFGPGHCNSCALGRDDFSSNVHHALLSSWRMFFSALPSPAEASSQTTKRARGFAQAGTGTHFSGSCSRPWPNLVPVLLLRSGVGWPLLTRRLSGPRLRGCIGPPARRWGQHKADCPGLLLNRLRGCKYPPNRLNFSKEAFNFFAHASLQEEAQNEDFRGDLDIHRPLAQRCCSNGTAHQADHRSCAWRVRRLIELVWRDRNS